MSLHICLSVCLIYITPFVCWLWHNNIPSNRFLPNIFPWHGHICNYGALPQTWESPYHQVEKIEENSNDNMLICQLPMCQYIPNMQDQWTGLIGDKDPVDVCEIGSLPRPSGTVLPVRFNCHKDMYKCCLLGYLHCYDDYVGLIWNFLRLLGVLAMIDDDATDWKVTQV